MCSTNRAQVPKEFYGRVTAVLASRVRFETAAQGIRPRDIKDNAGAKAAGLKLARIQRAYTKAWTQHKRRAERIGHKTSEPTKRPTTTQDYLSLILGEERKRNDLVKEQNALLRELVCHPLPRMLDSR